MKTATQASINIGSKVNEYLKRLPNCQAEKYGLESGFMVSRRLHQLVSGFTFVKERIATIYKFYKSSLICPQTPTNDKDNAAKDAFYLSINVQSLTAKSFLGILIWRSDGKVFLAQLAISSASMQPLPQFYEADRNTLVCCTKFQHFNIHLIASYRITSNLINHIIIEGKLSTMYMIKTNSKAQISTWSITLLDDEMWNNQWTLQCILYLKDPFKVMRTYYWQCSYGYHHPYVNNFGHW